MTKYIGQSVKRVEDKRFVTGKGKYTDDIILHGMCYAHIIRSPHANAIINSVDVSEARKMEGVVAIFTGTDIASSGINGVPCGWQVNFKNGDTMKEPPHPLLVKDKVRHLGDSVAIVIAEDRGTAKDAAQLVKINYEPHDAVVNPADAVKDGAPLIHQDVPKNICFDWEIGNPKSEVKEALENAHHVTTLEIVNQRLIPNAIEPRSVICDYNPVTENYTLYTSSQIPHVVRLLMCAFVLNLPEHKVRVISPDVGGGFGSKICHYTEEALITWCSGKIGRPVKWTSERSESFTCDIHGRDHVTKAQMAFDSDGKIVGLQVHTFANLGAYLSTFGPVIPTYLHGTVFQGLYTTPKINIDVTAVFTHTNPVEAYRGAGRPEATYLLERLVDLGAREMGIDQAEIRYKNFIPPFDGIEQPGYQTQVALLYDSGNYAPALAKALEIAGYDDFPGKQKKALEEGKIIGLGISTYVEACGIAPSAVVGSLGARAALYESAHVRVQPTGKVNVYTGSHAHGQGHETTFAQIVADRLGIAMEDIEVVHGDSEAVAFGMGTYGSRSLAVGGTAIVKSIDKIIEKGARIAAHKLEANPDDIEYVEGAWKVKGTDKSISFGDVALIAYVPHDYPKDLEPGMDFSSFYDPANFTFPFGAHVAIIEIEKDTGKVTLNRFIAVDDVGNVINPMIVEGQIHGGVTQGIGQALFEGAIHDDSGQLLNGSYLEYTMPRADDLPLFEVDRTVTPCPHNPLGVKGAGEAGTIGAAPAVVNAVVDALWSAGYKVKDLRMPLTSERVWKAMQNQG